MRHKATVLFLLITLCAVGLGTIETALSTDLSRSAGILWGVFLVLIPLTLCGMVWTGMTWAAMASVVYGTIGLALDLATLTSILGGHPGTNTLLLLSGLSAILNLLLIVFGGRAFWSCLQRSSPPESLPPSPPPRSSSSAT